MNNAYQLYDVMSYDAHYSGIERTSSDSQSPTKELTLEAPPFKQYILEDPLLHVPNCKMDFRWAVANVLQFFAATEQAGWLRQYNRNADRFLAGDCWIGAYGAIAMPQLEKCIFKLRESPNTRRAIVSMGGIEPEDINRPACWSFLHLLRSGNRLHMHVYQRSLGMHVMPYDCILLSHILLYVAHSLKAEVGCLHWTVGSLHVKSLADVTGIINPDSIKFTEGLLQSPKSCIAALKAGWETRLNDNILEVIS